MTPNLVLAATAAVLFATGVYLLLSRSISRALLGVILVGNGVNVIFLIAAGPAGRAPISSLNAEEAMTDPLPQAMVLTAIVITLGMTAFMLAMAHRSWQLSSSDDVEDDVEDLRLVELAERDDVTNREAEPGSDDELDEHGVESPAAAKAAAGTAKAGTAAGGTAAARPAAGR